MRTWNAAASTSGSRARMRRCASCLTATGLMKRLEEQHIYPSVRAAVAAYHAQFGAEAQ